MFRSLILLCILTGAAAAWPAGNEHVDSRRWIGLNPINAVPGKPTVQIVTDSGLRRIESLPWNSIVTDSATTGIADLLKAYGLAGASSPFSIGLTSGSLRTRTLFTYQLPGFWNDTFTTGPVTYGVPSLPHGGKTFQPGRPQVPQEGVLLAVPKNVQAIKVSIIDERTTDLREVGKVIPALPRITEIDIAAGRLPQYAENPDDYSSATLFPPNTFEFAGVERFGQVTAAHILFTPIQSSPLNSSLNVTTSMTIEVSYDVPLNPHPIPTRPVKNEVLRHLLLDFDSLPLETWPDDPPTTAAPLATTTGNSSPTTSAGPFHAASVKIQPDYVIITSTAMAGAVESLRIAHSDLGAITTTTEFIRAHFMTGDLENAIREFMRKTWIRPPIHFVLIGDEDTIPFHRTNILSPTTPGVMSDNYYADFDDNVYPDVSVARIPVSNDVSLTSNICSHLADYRVLRKEPMEWQKQIALIVGYDDLTDYTSDTTAIARDIKSTTAGRDLCITRMDYPQPREVLDELTTGTLVCSYLGHARETFWKVKQREMLQGENLRDVHNEKMPPLVLSICCYSAAMGENFEVFAETFLKTRKCVGIIGASDAVDFSRNGIFDIKLWNALLRCSTPGVALKEAKCSLLKDSSAGDCTTEVVKLYGFYGDPAAPVMRNQE